MGYKHPTFLTSQPSHFTIPGVIISWKVYKEMKELLGLDLDKNAIEDLRQAKEDREKSTRDAYVEVDSL